MKWTMHENSLFAILLRSRWWLSFAIGAAVIGTLLAVLPESWRGVAVMSGTPFIVIGAIAAWKQWRAPSRGRIDRTLSEVRAMSWGDFAGALEDAYRRDGFEVNRVANAPADFLIKKDWRTFVVSGKRWKVARTGIEPLRDLEAWRLAREAHEGIYIAVGEITDNARQFAANHKIQLVGGSELARLLPGAGRTRKRA
jgi:restriction system protein